MIPKIVTELVTRMTRSCRECSQALDCSIVEAVRRLETAVRMGDRLGVLVSGVELHDAVSAHGAPCGLVEAEGKLLGELRAMISQSLANPELGTGLEEAAMMPRGDRAA